MKLSLLKRIQRLQTGRVCLVGVGNLDDGDDGFGVVLAEELELAGVPNVVIGETTPERFLGLLPCFDHAIFLAAVDFEGAPGTVVLLDAVEMAQRFPQVSTQVFSLGLLAKMAEANGRTKAWLLAAQPEQVGAGKELSPTLQRTLIGLKGLLTRPAEDTPQ